MGSLSSKSTSSYERGREEKRRRNTKTKKKKTNKKKNKKNERGRGVSMHGDRARETVEGAIDIGFGSSLKFAKKAVKLNASLASEAAKVVREIEAKKRSGSSFAGGEARAKEASARRTAQETSPTKKNTSKGRPNKKS